MNKSDLKLLFLKKNMIPIWTNHIFSNFFRFVFANFILHEIKYIIIFFLFSVGSTKSRFHW
jgi:hypothetical protein